MVYRIVTASSLFDGHDAAINVFRRLFQNAGLEVIHIGHNRSVLQIVTAAIQEDVDAVCISSYQGGHMEFFRYLRKMLDDHGGQKIGIFGGGGGTILPSEIQTLQAEGITRLYHAEDGRQMGLRGIIKDAICLMQKNSEDQKFYKQLVEKVKKGSSLSDRELAKSLTFVEQDKLYPEIKKDLLEALENAQEKVPAVIGVTGPGGCGKSTLVDELIVRYFLAKKEGRIGVLAFDPTKKKTGGALLGDRIRMNAIYNGRVFLRSMGTRSRAAEFSQAIKPALSLMKRSEFDLILVETTGIGQGNSAIVELSDVSMYVMTSEYGASTQLEKIDMIDFADVIVVNKFDRLGSLDALDDVRHAFALSHDLQFMDKSRDELPVFGTIASDFNNPDLSRVFIYLMQLLEKKSLISGFDFEKIKREDNPHSFTIIPAEKTFYLKEIVETVKAYREKTKDLADKASTLYTSKGEVEKASKEQINKLLEDYHRKKEILSKEEYSYKIRDKVFTRPLFSKSLANLFIPKIALPKYREWGEIVTFLRKENFPGHYPYTAGVFPLKSEEEEVRRQFAGEGSPERTNARFHYLSEGDPAKRLSTAFDSVTLYGADPADRPDIYGKIGNSGVSIATLDDMKALYKGFDLVAPNTSVSLTINGPAPMILAMFLNTAIEQKTTRVAKNYEQMKADCLRVIRGTVQADILKEEQAQNTCIFSSKFALKMMGDIQEYFIKNKMENFYSISISGYHIAEAGANPITQLALTLANGFTIVEYYLSRGMAIDDFARNLSFFFSSGLDPEYSVLGRVARRIWAIVLREKYGANDRSCRLKYHMQTSGRSLHAQEIAFNDIRTTLQALTAISDNCNSLHTNAYDEAITTPTEESVRRAMAIQMIINQEFGVTKCENPTQGSFFMEELTDLVEDAVLEEFASLSRRGGVLGAMEKQYQRHKIQTESLKYEMMKASKELPIIGVNTFVSKTSQTDYQHINVVRATDEEKERQIARTKAFIENAGDKNQKALQRLRDVALTGGNIFEELMETVKFCSLGQISHLLYECGGEYRRSM